MLFVRELEVWSYPGNSVSLEGCDRLIEEIGDALGLPDTSLIPYHSIPDDSDIENLSICLSEGELTLADFLRFCDEQGIAADTNDSRSASEFLTFSYGQKLAWLHLPQEHDTTVCVAHILRELKAAGLSLIDREALVCLIN